MLSIIMCVCVCVCVCVYIHIYIYTYIWIIRRALDNHIMHYNIQHTSHPHK